MQDSVARGRMNRKAAGEKRNGFATTHRLILPPPTRWVRADSWEKFNLREDPVCEKASFGEFAGFSGQDKGF
jgi:hypothetical protein